MPGEDATILCAGGLQEGLQSKWGAANSGCTLSRLLLPGKSGSLFVGSEGTKGGLEAVEVNWEEEQKKIIDDQLAQSLFGLLGEQRELVQDDEDRIVRWLSKAPKRKGVPKWSVPLEAWLLMLRPRWRSFKRHGVGFTPKLEHGVHSYLQASTGHDQTERARAIDVASVRRTDSRQVQWEDRPTGPEAISHVGSDWQRVLQWGGGERNRASCTQLLFQHDWLSSQET